MATMESVTYVPLSGWNPDANALFLKDGEIAACDNIRIGEGSLQTRNGCKQFGTQIKENATTHRQDNSTGVGVPILRFHTFKKPNAEEVYFAFTAWNVYLYSSANGTWTQVSKDPLGTGGLQAAVSFWHTTDFLDLTVGSTVIAAGSNPPVEGATEGDGTARILLYWDSVNFVPISLTEELDVVDEALGVSGPGSATYVDFGPLTLVSSTNSIVDGSFSIGTKELGTLANVDTNVTTTTDWYTYQLMPVDQTVIQAGSGSYLRVARTTDTGRVAGKVYGRITFLNADYSGLALVCSYSYNQPQTYKPRFVWNFYNRLMMAGMYEDSAYYPWRMRWTSIGRKDKAVYTDYQDVVDVDITPVLGGDYLGPNLTILKRSSIYTLSYGNAQTPFIFTCVWKQGTMVGRSLQTINGRQYFLGESDIYVFDGNSLQSINKDKDGNHRIRNTIFSSLNKLYTWSCFGSTNLDENEYWLWITSSTTAPMMAYVYNIQHELWYKFSYSKAIGAVGYGRVTSISAIQDLVGSIAEQNWQFGVGDLASLNQAQVFGISDGTTYIDDPSLSSDWGIRSGATWTPGTAIASNLITRDFTFDDVSLQDRLQRVELDAYGTNLTLGVSGKYDTDLINFKQQKTITLQPKWFRALYHPDVTGYQFRLWISSTTSFKLRLILLYALKLRFTNR